MSFVIERDIPIPERRGGQDGIRMKRRTSPVGVAIAALEVSESFLMDKWDDYSKSRGLFTKYVDRRFVTRKTGQGWRIWRIE